MPASCSACISQELLLQQPKARKLPPAAGANVQSAGTMQQQYDMVSWRPVKRQHHLPATPLHQPVRQTHIQGRPFDASYAHTARCTSWQQHSLLPLHLPCPAPPRPASLQASGLHRCSATTAAAAAPASAGRTACNSALHALQLRTGTGRGQTHGP